MTTTSIVTRPLIFGLSAILLVACSPPPKPPPPPPPPPKVEPPPPPPPPPEETVNIPSPVTFAVASDRLTPESDTALKLLAEYLTKKKEVTRFRIEGHTDSDGNKADNQRLSEGRALSVARWLVEHGIDCKRLIAVGFGESKPIADNGTPEGRSQNRRTMFINAEVDGKLVGGKPIDGGGSVAGDACKKK
jgi:OmpA-OmpF porin, OOP family